MNAAVPLVYQPTVLDRIAWFLTRIGLPARAIRARHLEDISYHLQVKAMTLRNGATAREFQTILERAATVPSREWDFLATERDGRKVLVDNAFLKVVVIRWEPGGQCARHYHPHKSGLMMVLEGAVQESRFINDTIPTPYEVRNLQRHGMSYIDDTLGAHVVANPRETAAITLHAYLKYRTMGEA